MPTTTRPQRLLVTLLAFSLGFGGLAPAAQAGMIGTDEVAASQGLVTAADRRIRLRALLARDDVAAALAERGVGPAQARLRVDALTDAEAARLLAEIDSAPAGAGDLLGTLALVFVILVFTDILGYTHLFPFIHSTR